MTSPTRDQHEDGPRVLLIEDEERLLMGLAAVMRRAGFAVQTASNGTAGLQEARQWRPDIIVCDVMMPPPDGFQLKAELSEELATASIPFVFLTARTSQQDKLRGIEAGADDYITKPFDREELVARVRAVLRRNDLGRQQGRTETEARLERLRSTLMGDVSQELRRPLAALLSTLEGALDRRAEPAQDRLLGFLETAHDSACRLSSLVADLTVLAQLDSDDELSPRPLQGEAAVRTPATRCVEHWRRAEMRDLDLDLRIDPTATVHAPLELVQRAVFHLVDNACKFTREGSTIRVELSRGCDGGSRLAVTDAGPGIPEELAERAFERFFTGFEDGSMLHGGLGVGLSIARQLARRLGGDVRVESSDAGCTVAMHLPPPPSRATVHRFAPRTAAAAPAPLWSAG